jgi:hypothetical protein
MNHLLFSDAPFHDNLFFVKLDYIMMEMLILYCTLLSIIVMMIWGIKVYSSPKLSRIEEREHRYRDCPQALYLGTRVSLGSGRPSFFLHSLPVGAPGYCLQPFPGHQLHVLLPIEGPPADFDHRKSPLTGPAPQSENTYP